MALIVDQADRIIWLRDGAGNKFQLHCGGVILQRSVLTEFGTLYNIRIREAFQIKMSQSVNPPPHLGEGSWFKNGKISKLSPSPSLSGAEVSLFPVYPTNHPPPLKPLRESFFPSCSILSNNRWAYLIGSYLRFEWAWNLSVSVSVLI